MQLNMIRGANSDSIPIDLTIEILSRLPAKSAARFSCVSKLWRSMLGRPYFKELFLTRSSARPRLLFAVERYDGDWRFFSSPQLQNPYEKWTSLVVSADFHMTLPGHTWLKFCGHASGLIYFRRFIGTIGQVICNPSTGDYALLPKVRRIISTRSFLGFDPIDKQFKVLSISIPKSSGVKEELDQILTLGSGDDSWREIHCPLNHKPLNEGVCINGVLYYFAKENGERPSLIVCFDVRSEKFKFIYRDFMSDQRSISMINYKGKLGVITLEYSYDYNIWELMNRPGLCKSKDRRRSVKLCMWVIQHVEKPDSEWSEYVYTFWKNKVDGCNNVPTLWEDQAVRGDISVVGATATGEIVLSGNGASNPFYVFYLNPERAFEKRNKRVRVFVDHVEDLNFVNMKTADAATSTSPWRLLDAHEFSLICSLAN